VRRTCATISIVLTLAASLLGANPVAQAAHATRIASGASPAGWPPGCDPTDDMLTTDSRHYKVKPGGEVREVVRVELLYDSGVNLHINNNDRGDYVRGRVDLGVLKAGATTGAGRGTRTVARMRPTVTTGSPSTSRPLTRAATTRPAPLSGCTGATTPGRSPAAGRRSTRGPRPCMT
jgi:hypothetical protein